MQNKTNDSRPVKKKYVYVRRCKTCIHFRLPNVQEKWGWCIFRKIQRSKYQYHCNNLLTKAKMGTVQI